MGAGGRDFHDFNVVFRDDPAARVVAFTAAQIPGIDGRVYPPELAGPLYPEGIPIRDEDALGALVADERVDEVVFAYSDVSYSEVMHRAAIVEAAGADFRLLGPDTTMLPCRRPVVAVCAVRTGCGKSQTSRAICDLLLAAGLRPGLVRHPMPYGDLGAERVQRFASLADVDAASPTIEEREEYEVPVAAGIPVFAGIDYAAVRDLAEAECDVVVWDGGNNDFPFLRPDVWVTVADALRPGHETGYYPGEVNVRAADVVVVNKVDAADPTAVATVEANVAMANPRATRVRAASPVTLDGGPSLAGRRVVVVEDGPTVTHGGMAYGAGTVAARAAGAVVVDPRPWAVGEIAATYAHYPTIGPVLPALGYSEKQVADLAATLRAADCDVVLAGTPVDLARLVGEGKPVRRARYSYADAGPPTLATALGPHIARWAREA